MSNLNNLHNQGQKDASEGKSYERPHSHAEELFTWSSDGLTKLYEDNDAYRRGYDNASDD